MLSIKLQQLPAELPAALFNTFCLWNSAPSLSIESLTAFNHAVTRFTQLSDHSYVILEVRVVHCPHSGGGCRAISAWESARSLSGSPRCALTLTMNVRAPRITFFVSAKTHKRHHHHHHRSLTHSTIVVDYCSCGRDVPRINIV